MAVPLRIADPSQTPGLGWKHDTPPETLATGIGEVDGVIEGCPRGRITEIAGPTSSGRTTMLHAIVAEAGRVGEVSAVVDVCNSFDPASAAAAGVSLNRLLLVRCGGSLEHGLRAADLLVHSGGFGVIALDLCDTPDNELRRIPLSWWYRFRRAIEPTPTVMLVLDRDPVAKACSSMLVEMKRERAHFRGAYPFQYLDSTRYAARRRKPVSQGVASFEVRALE